LDPRCEVHVDGFAHGHKRDGGRWKIKVVTGRDER
jgi:hypothetical protein